MSVLDDLVKIASDIAQNFKRKVAKRPCGLFYGLARIAGGERDPEILSSSLDLAGAVDSGLVRVIVGRMTGKSVQVTDQTRNVVVAGVRLKAQLVLKGDRKSSDKVERSAAHGQ